MLEDCEKTSLLTRLLCRRTAEKWFEFVEINGFDYWDRVRCRPVFLYNDENECMDNTVGESDLCSGPSELWYPHRVIDNVFMF